MSVKKIKTFKQLLGDRFECVNELCVVLKGLKLKVSSRLLRFWLKVWINSNIKGAKKIMKW